VFAVLPDDEREQLLGSVSRMLDGHGIDRLDLAYRTDAYRARTRP